MERYHVESIKTFVFSNNGNAIIFNNPDNKLDTVPLLFLGSREADAKREKGQPYKVIINNTKDYVKEVAYYFGLYDQNISNNAIYDEWIIPNEDSILDVGQLYPHIADVQIKEMVELSIPSYIRIKKDIYELEKNIDNATEVRYVVLPEHLNHLDKDNVTEISIEDLENMARTTISTSTMSNDLLWFCNKDDLDALKSFSNKLKEHFKNTENAPKVSK